MLGTLSSPNSSMKLILL